jgi:uridine phosphorylase
MKSNWILNADGSIYHLKLHLDQLATTIITVGDPDRVPVITRYFDRIETSMRSREFNCVTGFLSGKRISVISTGIGTGGIDIVINEIDALFNLDLKSGNIHQNFTSLQFIRIGTSGAIQEHIPLDSLLISTHCISLDGMMNYYKDQSHAHDLPLELQAEIPGISRYLMYPADQKLVNHFKSPMILRGCTLTAPGFYAAQGRSTRIMNSSLLHKLKTWELESAGKIQNIEMETSGIYGLSTLMGHKAISLNALLANRITGEFSTKPEETIKRLIEYALEKISCLT